MNIPEAVTPPDFKQQELKFKDVKAVATHSKGNQKHTKIHIKIMELIENLYAREFLISRQKNTKNNLKNASHGNQMLHESCAALLFQRNNP